MMSSYAVVLAQLAATIYAGDLAAGKYTSEDPDTHAKETALDLARWAYEESQSR